VLAVCDVLRSVGGVSEATGNPSTGSVTIIYRQRVVTVDTIWQMLHREGIVASAFPAINEGTSERTIPTDPNGATAAAKVVDAVVGAVLGTVLERSALALLAALV